MERITFNFHGQEIAKEDQQKIKADLGFHLRPAPSDATACCCISNESEGFACNLRVHSAKGHFYIHRESKDLEQLMRYVYQSMERSFADWHRDPDHYSKNHPLEQIPCKGASHQDLPCPLDKLHPGTT